MSAGPEDDLLPPAAADPQQAPDVDSGLIQSAAAGPELAHAQSIGAMARRPQVLPYVPDFVNKPGAQRTRDARDASGLTTVSRMGQTMAAGGASAASLAQSLPVQMAGSGVAALAGGNPAELLAHAAQATQIMGIAAARSDPVKQGNFVTAQQENKAARTGLSTSMEAVRAADTGMVGDKRIDDIMADTGAHSQDEVTIASQARLLIRRRAANPDKSDAELLRTRTSGGRTAQAVRSVMANLRLGTASDVIGEKKLPELTPEQTTGTVVPPELVKDGHVADREARPKGSWWESIGNFFSSMNPWSSRPLGNTATLTAGEQAHAANRERVGRTWDALASNRKAYRGLQGMLGQLTGGYTPEESIRKAQLNGRIDTLEQTAGAERSARSRWFRGPRFTDEEQATYDSHGALISEQDARVKESQAAAIAGHQQGVDDLEQVKAANLAQRSRNWLPWKSGSYQFTDEEQAAHSELTAKADAITAGAQGRELTSEESSQLSQHRQAMSDMEQLRDTGLTRQQRQQYSGLQTSIAATRNNALFGLSAEDLTARHAAGAAQSEMTTTLETGLNRDQRAQLQAAQEERAEMRQFKKTGLTAQERGFQASAFADAQGVYRDAASKNSLLDTYGGQAVRTVTRAGQAQPEHRVGGLKHVDVTEEDTASTAGGWLAQAGRTMSGWLSYLGEVIGGKSMDAKKHIDRGDLAKASLITASGGAMESAAFAAPGAGGVARRVAGGAGGIVSGVAESARAGLDAPARREDLRNEQAKLMDGTRAQESGEQAIDWHGAVPHEAPSTASTVAMGLGKAAMGAGAVYYRSDSGQALKEHLLGKAPDPRGMSATQRVLHDGEKFATSAVTDNVMGMGRAAKSALASTPSQAPQPADGAVPVPASPSTVDTTGDTSDPGTSMRDSLMIGWGGQQDRSGHDRMPALRPEDMADTAEPAAPPAEPDDSFLDPEELDLV